MNAVINPVGTRHRCRRQSLNGSPLGFSWFELGAIPQSIQNIEVQNILPHDEQEHQSVRAAHDANGEKQSQQGRNGLPNVELGAESNGCGDASGEKRLADRVQ